MDIGSSRGSWTLIIAGPTTKERIRKENNEDGREKYSLGEGRKRVLMGN